MQQNTGRERKNSIQADVDRYYSYSRRGESRRSMTSPPTLELWYKGETAANTGRTGLGGRRRLDPNMASRRFATGCDRALYGIVLSHAPKSSESWAGGRTAD